MIGTMLQGLNIKKFILATLAVFATVWVTDFIIHGVLMKDAYMASASVWRSPEEMKKYFPWMLLGQFLIAKGFTFIFAKGYEGKGIAEGLRFGLFVWPLVFGGILIQYVVYPLPCAVACPWLVTSLVQLLMMGAVASLVYKRA